MGPSQRETPTPRTAVEVGSERQAAAAAVVAEAVALALEAVAAEAAEGVLAAAAAVTEAAGRAADAAESARRARAFAADAAAQSVADEASRTATRMRERADLAAAQVHQAAALAADQLDHSIEEGTALDSGHVAERLAATVDAAADATTQDTGRAASDVKHAAAAAAAQVAQTVAAAEAVVEREVTATADALRELATATAVGVELETGARAAGVATVARQAAAALVTAEQEPRAVDHATDLETHELTTPARAARAPVRGEELQAILAAADQRDARAELRDRVADERERAASLDSFLGSQRPEPYDQHSADLAARRLAALDRLDAMTDRASAASDRAQLSAPPPPGFGGGGFSERARTSEVVGDLSDVRVPLSSIIASVEMLEVALRESDDRLRFLVDAVTEYAIFTLDPDGIIGSWNTGAERLKGYTAEEALGRHISLFYTAADRDAGLPQKSLDRARADGSYEHTGWRVRSDGSQFWGDVTISAVHDDGGSLTGFVKVTRDLTEQHRLEVAQDSFYNAFEHDFRVPITAIKGFAELITEADPVDQEYLVERIDSNADRLQTMVGELVDYARLRSGLIPISLQTVDLASLAELAVANLASIAETSRIQVAASSVKVLADPVALERVIANLVTNALKYSPAESNIDLICERVEDVGVLRIVDQGRGIDERDLGSIFLEFERGRLAQDDSGTGLGLASVQRLVGLQDGTVAITSQVDVGTTVTIQLPLAP